VESSAVRAVRFDATTAELDVRFEEGHEYRYSRVPRSKFRALLAADSIGAFVNCEIKPSHPCREITPRSRSLPAYGWE
jgi:hypothetical protein